MFPIDKRLVQVVTYPAPDVVPEILFALDDVPMALWNEHTDLYELADAIEPYLNRYGARKWDFIWTMERHFSEPYGPLPKAKQTFMAGIPDMFIASTGGSTSDSGARMIEEGVLSAQAAVNAVEQTDVEPKARPYAYEPGMDMPDEYVFWLEKLMFAHGECMMPYFGEKSKGHVNMFAGIDELTLQLAPDAASRLRANNFASEEFKHTFQFYEVYQAFDAELPVRIYEHEREVFRAYEAMKEEPTWIDRSINNMMSDRFGVYQGFEWVQSSYAPLARVSLKVVKDERGHSNMGYVHTRQALEEHPSLRGGAQRRISEYWMPYFLAGFGSDDSRNNRSWREWGLKQHTNGELREAYFAEMVEVLGSLGLEAPEYEETLDRGLEMAGRGRNQ